MYNVGKIVKKSIFYLISIFWSVVTVFPLLFTLVSSLKNNDEIYSTMFSLPKVYRLENYIQAFTTANIELALVNSVFISGSATLVLILVGSMASYVLSRYRYKFNTPLLIYFTMGIMIPSQCALIPIVKIISSVQGRNSYLSMILIYAALNLPINIYIIANYMKTISKEIDESAIIDGCSPVKLLFRIIMPISMPGISTAAIISFLFIYNELIYASVFLSKKSMYTVSLALLSFRGRMDMQIGPTFATIILSIFPMVVFYLFFQEKVEKGLTSGAVKG